MCGIAGIIDYSGDRERVTVVKSMLRAISHRGPDESGIYNSACATIGNVRLSFIDIKTGQQPLTDATGRYWIVYNGEIFNYIELREELEASGIKFRSQSDTEVLVNLYARHGEKCLSRLNGEFAFAIWDTAEETLFMARDRVGVRPLFYTVVNGKLSFGSEIKALFANREVRREFDHSHLAQIYTFWTTITPATAFSGVSELAPGHFMLFSRKGLVLKKYWELSFSHTNPSITTEEAVERYHELLADAVKLRLRTEVEVAAYLSGGIDSSATVWYMKEIRQGPVTTFSIGFEEHEYDESSFQNEAVNHLNTNHSAIRCTAREIADIFPKVIWHSETPLTRTAPAPMYFLSGLVADNGYKVVITGEGSDEILAGYDIFREALIRRFWASQPGSALRPILLKRIYPDIPHLRNASPGILKMFFGYRLEDTDNPLYSHLLRWNNSNHIKKHLSAASREQAGSYDPLADLSGRLPESFMEWSPLARAQWLETTLFMSGYLVSSQGDRMLMANSVEGRFPFLDHRLIEFCSSLPDRLKLNGLNEKYLLKRLMTGRIPDSIVRRPKHPYRAPITTVFTGKKRPGYIDEMLSEAMTKQAGVFNHDSVTALTDKIDKTGTASEMDNMVLTAVISTHLLYHQYIQNNNSEFGNAPLHNLRIIEE